ncbi:MAG: YggS family pyridoxal phosphate-dependent enzyme [Proteobacteria bacterium]|jgi:pyridoxal phosphate enzyme (YggS family)|nr:YggS family pyridoxal phosphate-dependent enzyme [Alphaproteobacteria bacterium]NCC03691.1 YggS family pyridoxal phosphate-dependent enzyme [Pseudomonadota bacterium]
MTNYSQNLKDVQARIRQATRLAGREQNAVTLIAASKTQPRSALLDLLAAGQCHFGENRVQEALEKFKELRAQHPEITIHLIGPLQTNKVKQAMALFDVIQTIDRPELARKVALEAKKQGRCPRLFIQVNTGEEAQKAGILPKDFSSLLALCRDELDLKIEGLMCIPPVGSDPSIHFILLKNMAETHDIPHLSMGMSDDFEKAIACGATFVRIGTTLFGKRTLSMP